MPLRPMIMIFLRDSVLATQKKKKERFTCSNNDPFRKQSQLLLHAIRSLRV
ncbi:hypothetical protein X777_00873 [Ooceraea biroi]|uniref:Uncharacterized protein n=1 Tax=Ooceraea biroi TaxID=2015173 RepID=A0A026WQ08_OOCBI|nr:hypothetical protein X777_00873 [Ooceraea biroi]